MSLLSTPIWSSKDCFNISKLWWVLTSALRRSLNWPSAFSFKSSKTSRMLLLWLVYVAAAGAPNSESSSSAFAWACTKAANFFWSEPGKAAASSTVLRAWSMLFKPFLLLICIKAAGFLAISRCSTAEARSKASTASTSSPSLALKSASSFARIDVAFASSASAEEIEPARSSIFSLATAALLVSSSILASSLATSFLPDSIENTPFLEVSSHQSKYSL
mmetsp:Transcript_89808/g.242593  ORF Transcript_89808/g.242593 Transcript_89808/m.242593 type:complete len:219 (+) Transcript_89808:1387-2043(+)